MSDSARSLHDLQTTMARLLRERRSLEKSPSAVHFAAEEISGSSRLLPIEQLEIYREQFWLRHTAALLEDFPGLSGIIGQSSWERLAEEYLCEIPPASFSLRDLGRDLPEFVARASWLEQRELCHDMARLEWAYVEAFDAADAPLLDTARLAAISDEAWERARLLLAPSLSLLELRYPVVELRRALVSETSDGVPIPEPCPNFLAVCRRELSVRSHPLERASFHLLQELASGAALVPAATSTAQRLGVTAEALLPSLGGWFAAWAAEGVVVDVLA